eukprot:Skav223024  [mRNA]  locus=scaffold1422:192256:196207:- [translate_table: standard]
MSSTGSGTSSIASAASGGSMSQSAVRSISSLLLTPPYGSCCAGMSNEGGAELLTFFSRILPVRVARPSARRRFALAASDDASAASAARAPFRAPTALSSS